MAKPKMGRPYRTGKRAALDRVELRVTSAELAEWRALASDIEETLSECVRIAMRELKARRAA